MLGECNKLLLKVQALCSQKCTWFGHTRRRCRLKSGRRLLRRFQGGFFSESFFWSCTVVFREKTLFKGRRMLSGYSGLAISNSLSLREWRVFLATVLQWECENRRLWRGQKHVANAINFVKRFYPWKATWRTTRILIRSKWNLVLPWKGFIIFNNIMGKLIGRDDNFVRADSDRYDFDSFWTCVCFDQFRQKTKTRFKFQLSD